LRNNRSISSASRCSGQFSYGSDIVVLELVGYTGSSSLSRNQHEVLGILRVQHVMPILGGRFYNHDTRTIFFKAVIRCDVARHSIGHKLNSRALTVETHKITV